MRMSFTPLLSCWISGYITLTLTPFSQEIIKLILSGIIAIVIHSIHARVKARKEAEK